MSYQALSHDDAMDFLSRESNWVVLDVRDLDAYRQSHISNALHLSVDQLSQFCQQHEKNKPLLVYCYHGISSRAVAQHLVDQGFTAVYSLDGGFEVWQSNHPTETSSAK